MVDFPEQELLTIFEATTFRNVSGNLRCADDFASFSTKGRDRDRNLDKVAILALSHRLEIVNPLATADSFKNGILFLYPILGNQNENGLPDRFSRRKAEDAFRTRVPGRDCDIMEQVPQSIDVSLEIVTATTSELTAWSISGCLEQMNGDLCWYRFSR
ncbi:hypothetical protein QA646_30490 (plasmid) [Rhizobium sp. CB3090]|uniref:hypothetical protein n=1 Tax=Rhizobium sp. CB3090 TaxID=3039156 RepID=UPI0024B0FFFA|nr:hypothetical protein [Rhizobium sp. CB3090]WFU13311.1 hypothetical protein QA646_30490 [Rhizobium sp. CB3090]